MQQMSTGPAARGEPEGLGKDPVVIVRLPIPRPKPALVPWTAEEDDRVREATKNAWPDVDCECFVDLEALCCSCAA